MPRKKQENESANGTQNGSVQIVELYLNNIVPSGLKPQEFRRQRFQNEELEELAESIRQQGLISPIVVRPSGEIGNHEIICGERRWLASKRAGLETIPCLIRNLPDNIALELQMQENLQRKDIDPLDEAFSYKYLIENHNYTIHDLAIKFGKSEKNIHQKVRLNDLIPEVLKELADASLPLGHAVEIAKYPTEIQREIVGKKHAYKWHDKNYGAISLKDFKEQIEINIVCKLENASFDTELRDLHPEGLICSECPERTGFTPTLFADDFGRKDCCLNKDCFLNKTIRNLELQRTAAAADFPNPEDLPQEQLIKEVPLVSDSWMNEKLLPDGKYLERQTFYDEPECDSAVPAVIVKGERMGQRTFICPDKDCPVHQNSDEEDNTPSRWQLENEEREFQTKVGMAVREKVFSEAVEYFAGGVSFWEREDLVADLIVNFILSQKYYLGNLLPAVFKNWEHLPKDLNNENQVIGFVKSLNETQKNQILFLLTFCREGHSSWRLEPQDAVKQIAAEFASLDYRLLDAETRVELAPKEFKQQAKDYLKAVKKGNDIEVPHFWWSESAEEEEDEDFDEDLEPGDDDFEDEEDLDENDLGETSQG